MIIDSHLHWYLDNPEFNPEVLVKSGVIHGGWMLSANAIVRGQANDEQIIELCNKYPDFFVPFGYLDLDEAGPERVDWLCDQGCIGLKAIFPGKAYDDPACFPYYERAQARGMPIVFHVGGSPYHGPDEVTIDPAKRELSKYMIVMTMDAVAKTFPDLTIVMAHMGANYDSILANYITRGHANVYMDLSASGEEFVKKGIKSAGPEKILFGSDARYGSAVAQAQSWLAFFGYHETNEQAYRDLVGEGWFKIHGLSDKPRRLVMGENAVRIVAAAKAKQGR